MEDWQSRSKYRLKNIKNIENIWYVLQPSKPETFKNRSVQNASRQFIIEQILQRFIGFEIRQWKKFRLHDQ